MVGGEAETCECLGDWEDQAGEEVDGLAFERVGQRVRRVLSWVLEFAVLDQDRVDVLENEGESLVGVRAQLCHLAVEIVEERVDVLSLIGEQQRSDGPDAEVHFTDDAK